MKRQADRCAPAALAVMLACAGLTGCSSDGPNGATASSAASAARSRASAGASAASSAAASAVGSAVASAEAAAEAALRKIKGGLDAKADVTLGTAATGSDGRIEVPVNVVNHDSEARRYTLLIKFKDQSGNPVDMVTVDVPEVAAGGTDHATARSNRNLTGTVTAEVSKAVRY
ncbi:hypothetical protein [Streptomyces sp. URMC 124]|uniref:hypothetical protein n=1 Tax=Streptomyces sp. URMC 124 TaxID=3423405 RepID=UPI003F1D22BA